MKVRNPCGICKNMITLSVVDLNFVALLDSTFVSRILNDVPLFPSFPTTYLTAISSKPRVISNYFNFSLLIVATLFMTEFVIFWVLFRAITVFMTFKIFCEPSKVYTRRFIPEMVQVKLLRQWVTSLTK